MKWTKLEYGKWPEGEIVMRTVDDKGKVDFSHGYISRFNYTGEIYFYDYDGPNFIMSVEYICNNNLHFLQLDKVEMPE